MTKRDHTPPPATRPASRLRRASAPRATVAPKPAAAAPTAVAEQHISATFCFVDIAGYTALTDTHGEQAAADLIDSFTRLVHAAVDGRGTVHELSGDNAFLVFPDPLSAMQTLADLYKAAADTDDFPLLRAGMHHGSALCRSNRYFGSSVNIAARTAAQAVGGEIMCTAPVALALASASDHDVQVRSVGKVKLKNLPQALDLYRVEVTDSPGTFAIDPVCQMRVDIRSAAADGWFNGTRYWFCSSGCSRQFAKSPADFI